MNLNNIYVSFKLAHFCSLDFNKKFSMFSMWKLSWRTSSDTVGSPTHMDSAIRVCFEKLVKDSNVKALFVSSTPTELYIPVI